MKLMHPGLCIRKWVVVSNGEWKERGLVMEENLGWLWTDEKFYPFLYQNTSASWLYFYGASQDYYSTIIAMSDGYR